MMANRDMISTNASADFGEGVAVSGSAESPSG